MGLWTRLLAIGLVLLAAGCDQECRDLCTAWFDYQRDVCGVLDTEDDRVTCISDYRSGRVTEEELQACSSWAARIEALDAAGDAACCDATGPSCAGGDDDDSSGG